MLLLSYCEVHNKTSLFFQRLRKPQPQVAYCINKLEKGKRKQAQYFWNMESNLLFMKMHCPTLSSVFLSPTPQECGIPKHFGLFYAMGTALMMEGLLSACYHVCPNYTNFQFGKRASFPTRTLGFFVRRQNTSTNQPSDVKLASITQLSVVSSILFTTLLFECVFVVMLTGN